MTCYLIGSNESGLIDTTLTDNEATALGTVAGGTLAAASTQFFTSGAGIYSLNTATGGTSGVSYQEIDWGSDLTVIYGMVKVMFPTAPSAITAVIAITDSVPTQLFAIRVNASGFWQVNNNANSTVYTSTVYKPVANVMHRVEFYWKQDASVGEFTIKVDGVADADLTKTSLNNGTAKPRRLRIGVVEAQANAPTRYIDDYIINDNSGTRNNTWVGNGRVRALSPGGSNTANWTVVDSGKADWQTLTDKPWASATTDMIKSSSSSQADDMTLQAFGSDSTSLTIIAACAMIRQRRGVAGSAASVDFNIRSSGADGGAVTADSGSTTWKTFRGTLLETDPNTSATWTLAAINAMLIRLVHQANTNECDVNAAMVYVAFVMSDAVKESIYNSGVITHPTFKGERMDLFKPELQRRRGRHPHKATIQ